VRDRVERWFVLTGRVIAGGVALLLAAVAVLLMIGGFRNNDWFLVIFSLIFFGFAGFAGTYVGSDK
jgi:hypothetical protein